MHAINGAPASALSPRETEILRMVAGGESNTGRRRPNQRSVPTYPGGLSEREVQILRLIAQGKSNQQIADQLVISFNTVIRHITHVYTKIGVSNRAGAVDYAHRGGILERKE